MVALLVSGRTIQGLIMAYYYDHIRSNTTVELDQCRFNHMGHVVCIATIVYVEMTGFTANTTKTAWLPIWTRFIVFTLPCAKIHDSISPEAGAPGYNVRMIQHTAVNMDHCHEGVASSMT
jgi:hypothetical protein